MSDKIKLTDDEVSDFMPTDSEDEYSEDEKKILQEACKARHRPEDSPIKEILAFSESEDDEVDDENEDDAEHDENDENDVDLADSDIEGLEYNDDLPDTKYWGKKSSDYYNTDFVDEDYSSYNDKEREMADFEEEEAKRIQLRLAKELKENDFQLDYRTSLNENEITDTMGCYLESNFSGLSRRERLQLFEKDSPEFSSLVGDLEGYLEELEKIHNPVLLYVRKHNIPMIPALQFADIYQNIALNYCNNLMFYLLLKTKHTPVQNHPIINKLSQLKNLLNQLDDRHENIVKPQLEAMLERIVDGDIFEVETIKDGDQAKSKNRSINYLEDDYKDDNDDLAEIVEDGKECEDMRRGITYQIAKNKGLTPYRKKEQRNPRVKHRGKYRKALIKRKGAVRTVRKEISKYGGEISGIKSSVSRSVKFKY